MTLCACRILKRFLHFRESFVSYWKKFLLALIGAVGEDHWKSWEFVVIVLKGKITFIKGNDVSFYFFFSLISLIEVPEFCCLVDLETCKDKSLY